MTSQKLGLYLVAFIALAVFSIASVSAFGSITSVEVNGVENAQIEGTYPISVNAGDTIPVRVFFHSDDNASDVRVKAWIAGEKDLQAVSVRNIVQESTLSVFLLNVKVPNDLDNRISEKLELNIVVDGSSNGVRQEADEETVLLNLQRKPYIVDVLDVEMPNEVTAGETLPVNVVLKNIGAEFADDTFVTVRIDALGVQDRAYFGDLSSTDEPFSKDPFYVGAGNDRLDKEDSAERRLFLKIPLNANAGIYDVVVEAYNDDSSTIVTRKIAVSGVEGSTTVVAPVHSKSFGVGEKEDFSLTIVNTGNSIRVYELIVESPSGLSVEVSDSVVAVPAGSSMTVKLTSEADKAGRYDFAVNVHSDAELVKREGFTANVSGSDVNVASPTVLLTVVLAIIFIVLLIVLIVLLTRRPERTDESGEGYY